jgi:hypothetical protein
MLCYGAVLCCARICRSTPRASTPSLFVSWQGWKSLGEVPVQLFAACNVPYLSTDHKLAPEAEISNGAHAFVAAATRVSGLVEDAPKGGGMQLWFDLPMGGTRN